MIFLRRANFVDDKEDILKWRNDEVTRSNSFNNRIIEWHEHSVWLDRKLKDVNCHIFILEHGLEKVGIVILDKQVPDDFWKVSINIAPEARNKGYAKQAIESLKKSGYKMIAQVKSGNDISNKLFQQAGFKPYYIEYRYEN